MKCSDWLTAIVLIAGVPMAGCTKSPDSAAGKKTAAAPTPTAGADAGADVHGAGPNGGVVFDLGAYHAEFTVDHGKQQCKIVLLDADGKSPVSAAASELIVSINETKTADGKAVAPMTVVMSPTDMVDGKATTFVGTDPGIGNVADFAGAVSGQIDGKPATGMFDEAGSGHGHAHTPHDGMIAPLKDSGSQEVGFVELKLHDDKGDLEAWLAKDRGITQPLDLQVDSKLQVAFRDRPGKTATLAVRNKEQNEDEDGKPNLRNGQTNYFIFPGDSGQDPEWLKGAEFKSVVRLTFTANGQTFTSDEFVLVPHTHGPGGHTH